MSPFHAASMSGRVAALAFLLCPAQVDAEQWELPLSVSAKSIATTVRPADNNSMPMMAPVQTTVPETLPQGRLPQYQLKYRQRDAISATQHDDGVLWFRLGNESARLTVKATVRINGKPFAQQRTEQVKGLVSLAESMAEPAKASDSIEAKSPPEEDAIADRETSDEEKTVDAPVESPVSLPAYTVASTPEELMRRYAVATGGASGDEAINDETVAWLMTNWSAGPPLLLLKDPFQWYRSQQRPVFEVLDRDRDGILSAKELKIASDSLAQCDTNNDEIVDAMEIDQASKNAEVIPQAFQRRIKLLSEALPKADLQIEVDFVADANGKSKLTLVEIDESLAGKLTRLQATDDTITFLFGAIPFEVSAVQSGASDQVSLGAVVEGYPLLSAADANGDGRVTIRERRQLVKRLLQSDRNDDGELSGDETSPTTRLCFGLGPVVHRELVNLRSDRDASTPAKTTPVPEWFTRMDRNQDQDLSRSEFPGTDQQFLSLDFDRDGLIASGEAVRFDEQAER
ncbi:hypothetical protein [Planctomycetes bacterium K23_9]|uniref:EF hand n=1 Tax=Stieleria marina TaxID=1930275 RepID=A0A517P0M9_9BACT|nr:EF hand [Planctomycetes bacterium K23_9]